MNSGNPLVDLMSKFTKKMRLIGLVLSAVLILLGILAVTLPARASLVIAWLFLLGVVVSGIFGILRYVQAQPEARQTWALINGILRVILGVVAILVTKKPGKVFILSTAFCFTMVTAGVGRLGAASLLKREGKGGRGWLIFCGVLDLVCALFFITSPFMMTVAYEFVLGIYMIIGGFTLLVEILSEP